ncbi:tetratricopeptide repeat protein [Micromonospora sp. D93]|uniref:cyclophane-containing RiPP biosynthesis TPR protein HaaT n=1 Tax=Micromonospora sp. D93 TaxID=2824886 RepID=UPI001B35DAA5|nr:cyclophane-containing RiPP biosynthesis TPR protein HaaT [Micromonospora sp. D93]MBQ1019842.1 tetratricopeptide repeat protein [Micromonospora sp. D93]
MLIVKLRRVTVAALVAAGVAAVTLMTGLVTNAASNEQQWPGWLSLVQRHPWQSFLLLAVVAVVLAALLPGLTDPGQVGVRQADDEPTPSVGSAAVLRTLPRDVAGFTNRWDEIEQILNDASKDQLIMPVRTIDGMAGVGKTAFAIHVGHLLAPKFPDGQLFLNLNGHTPGREPVGPAEALASLLLADGVAPQKIPNSDDQWAMTEARAALWRTRVADRRMLLILDNAATYAQVEQLLPGAAGSLVLVTSRRRLAALDGTSLQMSALSATDAAALFMRLAGRSRVSKESVGELVAACGYLPLAVALLAARLRHHPSWSVEDLKDRLLSTQHRLSEMQAGERAVAAAFDLSYQDLPAERQRFFRRLSRFPGLDVDEEAAAALASVSQEVARSELEALYGDHLLDETEHGRYRFHDLVRDYGRSLGEDGQDGTMSIENLAGHYLETIGAANTHINRGSTTTTTRFDSLATASAWLDAERANVLACVEECVRREQHALVVGLAAVMAPYLRQAGPWDQAADLHRTAVVAARRTGDRKAEANALANLGMVSRLMARYRAAVETLDESLAIYRALSDLHGQASVLNQLGIVHYLTAMYDEAARTQTEALSICRETGDMLGQANALADLGMVRRMTGDLGPSAEASTEALEIYRLIGDRFGEANALRDLGLVRSLTGDYAEAEHNAREALAIYTRIGDPVHQAYALNELGVACRLKGDLDGATESHEQALAKYAELGDRFGEANAIRHLGVLHRLRGDQATAIEAQERALTLYAELESRGGLAAATAELGVLRRLAGNLVGARSGLDSAAAWYVELGDRTGQLEVHNHIGALHLDAGELDRANERYELALSLARELGVPLQEAHALDGLARCELALGRPERAADLHSAAQMLHERLGNQPT